MIHSNLNEIFAFLRKFSFGCISNLSKKEITIWNREQNMVKNYNGVLFRLKEGLDEWQLKGWRMGPMLVLVCSCFRENVVVTCKVGSFLYILDILLQKNVIILFFGNQISKWPSFEKKGLFLTYFSHFSVTKEKLQKFLQHISHSRTYMYFAHPIDFLPYQFWKNKQNKTTNLSGMVLFVVIPGVDSYLCHFGTINK